MNGVIAWFARNSVAANLLMVVILAAGAFSVSRLKQEVFPEIDAGTVSVTVPYLGAAPEEVETAICQRIEERIQDLAGVKRIRSTAAEGIGTVVVELLSDVDGREALDDIKARVDSIDTFPAEAEKPIIEEVTLRRQVINVAIFGEAGERTLKRLGEQVRDDLLAIPGITQVQLAAARPYEISIEVSEEDLQRHSLSFDEVAQAVRRSSLDLPGGSIRTEGGEILLRATGQAYRGREFEDIVLRDRRDGSRLLLGDVARVVDGFAQTDQAARFDGQPAVLVQVFRVGEQSALKVSDMVKEYVREAAADLPEGIGLTTWQDDTVVLRSRLSLMLRNGRAGLILVFLVLALFLKLRLAGWVALGIPVSFLGALWMMPLMGVSISLISLFAFIIVLGIVVDDAIVVGENVYRHLEMGKAPMEAAVEGAREVGMPVIFSVLTTIAAFAPLVAVQGNTGQVMRVIPLVVIATLFFSLVESLLILPAHLAHTRVGNARAGESRARGWRGIWQGFQRGFSRRLERFVERVYQPTLEVVLSWRYTFVAACFGLLLITGGLVRGGWIHFTFFPPVEADNVAAFLAMPAGTPAEVTSRVIEKIEVKALELQQQLAEEGDADAFRHVLSSTGEQPFRKAQAQSGGQISEEFAASHIGEITVELAPAEERAITSTEIANRWRELVGEIPDARDLVFTSSLFSTGEAINIQLAGPDLETLQAAAEELKQRLRSYPGVFDLADSFKAGKQELKVRITPEAESRGLALSDLARQVRQAFYGEEAQRIQRGRDEVRVMVRYPEDQRRQLHTLEQMRIRTADGGEIPFAVAGTAQLGRGFSAIQRVDHRRVVNVTADVDPAKANANQILADLQATDLPQILQAFPRVRYTLEGQQQQQRETMGGVFRGFLFALLVIYGLLAVPFKSYLQPAIIMVAIPFGLIGAIWGHIFMGLDLTLLSGFGIVALTGVVVNDSLVMVHFINQKFRTGDLGLQAAIRQAGTQRFRPIVLTSLTTFVGLLPLLLERSLQAQFLIPMAVSLAFGVLFATVITLMIVPVGYLILEDFKNLWRSSEAPEGPNPEAPNPEAPAPEAPNPEAPPVA